MTRQDPRLAAIRRRAVGATILAATIGALVGCSSEPLAQRDPAGYKACQLLITSKDKDESQMTRLAASMTGIGQAAKESTIAAIRSSAKPVFSDKDRQDVSDAGTDSSAFDGFYKINDKALAKACEREGVDIPAV